MNGTSWEYVAGILDGRLANGGYYDFTGTDSKYYNVYTDYNETKKIKGEAMYETSTSGSDGPNAWHQDYTPFIHSSYPVFLRGRWFRR